MDSPLSPRDKPGKSSIATLIEQQRSLLYPNPVSSVEPLTKRAAARIQNLAELKTYKLKPMNKTRLENAQVLHRTLAFVAVAGTLQDVPQELAASGDDVSFFAGNYGSPSVALSKEAKKKVF